MPARTYEARSLIGQIGAHTSWAHTVDRSDRTAPARAAARDRFEREVDPEGVLAPEVRAQLAEHAQLAHMKRMAFRSAESRRKAREARQAAVELDRAAEAADADLAAGGGAA